MKKKYFYFVLLGIMLLIIAACEPTISNTPPIAPSNPEPSNGASGVSVKPLLNWSLSLDSDGDSVKYDLYFGTTQTNLSLRANDLTTNFYIFTESLDEGRRYYWKVVAKDGKGGQTEGPVWSFTTEEKPTNTVPEPPTNLNAEVLSPSEIKLTWTDNSDNETGFKIERKVGTTGSWSQIKTVGANIREYTDSGLNPNTTYYYRVRAYNSAGDSSYSTEASATTQPPSNPREVGRCDIGSATEGVYLKENYAYMVDRFNGLFVVDVSNPIHPQEVGHYDTVGDARDVYVKEGYAYVADWYNGLVVVDVSNPTQPQQVGHYDTDGSAQGIYVEEGYAYVADGGNGLVIVEISNPTDPKQVGHCETASYAHGVYVKEDYAYVADRIRGLLIVDVSDPTKPKEAGHYNTATDSVHGDVYVKDNYAYVAEGDLVIVDVSNPTQPQEVGRYDPPSGPVDVYAKDNYAYVADYNNGLIIVDVSYLENITF